MSFDAMSWQGLLQAFGSKSRRDARFSLQPFCESNVRVSLLSWCVYVEESIPWSECHCHFVQIHCNKNHSYYMM